MLRTAIELFVTITGKSPAHGAVDLVMASAVGDERHGKFEVSYMKEEEYKRKSEVVMGQELRVKIWSEIVEV